MLVDILRMPPVLGIPIDRRITIYSGDHVPIFPQGKYLHWPTVPLQHEEMLVGSHITISPQNIFKAVHVAHNGQYVFETVFAQEHNICTCLYTKVISPNRVDVCISLQAVTWYQTDKHHVSPVTQFINIEGEDPYRTYDLAMYSNILDTDINSTDHIVPPIFDETQLWPYIYHTMAMREEGNVDSHLATLHRHIYDEEPSVFEALVEGAFHQTPFHQILTAHPMVSIPHERWFGFEQSDYMIQAQGFQRFVNHPEFDVVVGDIISTLPAKFTVTATMNHAVDGIDALWLVRDYLDPYQQLLRGSDSYETLFRGQLTTIFHKAAMIYCKKAGVDYTDYLKDSFDKSSITISKNMMDEVSIIFHDLIHGHYICFYTSYTALALTTLAAAWYK